MKVNTTTTMFHNKSTSTKDSNNKRMLSGKERSYKFIYVI